MGRPARSQNAYLASRQADFSSNTNLYLSSHSYSFSWDHNYYSVGGDQMGDIRTVVVTGKRALWRSYRHILTG